MKVVCGSISVCVTIVNNQLCQTVPWCSEQTPEQDGTCSNKQQSVSMWTMWNCYKLSTPAQIWQWCQEHHCSFFFATRHCKKRCSTNIKPIHKVILYLTQRPQHVLLFGINWICYLVDWSVASRKGLVDLELSQVSLQSRWYMPFSGKCWMQHAILFSQLFTDAAAAANMEMLCKYLPTNQMYNIPNVHFIQKSHHHQARWCCCFESVKKSWELSLLQQLRCWEAENKHKDK